MKFLLAFCAAILTLGGDYAAAAIVNTTYTTNTAYTVDDFLESGTATWTINPGVTVSTTTTLGRFFIGSLAAPTTSTDALFVVNGGGTLLVTNTSAFTFRLGQNQSTEGGVLRIEGGSLVNFTGNQGPWSEESDGAGDGFLDSRIILSGLGSTLMAEGTYNSSTGLYNRGATASEALSVQVVGGVLSSSYNAGTNVTTLTVVAAVPEPSTMLGLGLAAVSLVVVRRRQTMSKRQS